MTADPSDAMRNLAIFIGVGWFWLFFYSVGPITSSSGLAAGGITLAIGCLVSALVGLAAARRRPPR